MWRCRRWQEYCLWSTYTLLPCIPLVHNALDKVWLKAKFQDCMCTCAFLKSMRHCCAMLSSSSLPTSRGETVRLQGEVPLQAGRHDEHCRIA